MERVDERDCSRIEVLTRRLAGTVDAYSSAILGP